MKQRETFTLSNFEGPLEFLLHLVQKEEIDIYEISLKEILSQYLKQQESEEGVDVDGGAEFIRIASLLFYLKSRMLLPKEELKFEEEEEVDPRFEIIHQLIDYCKFKEAAKNLSRIEEGQLLHYGRGGESPYPIKKNLGIEHLTLQDFASLFQEIIKKSVKKNKLIEEEVWLVKDKIEFIIESLKETEELKFENLFSLELSREELIVTFLALLELMKMGKILVIKDNGEVWIRSGNG